MRRTTFEDKAGKLHALKTHSCGGGHTKKPFSYVKFALKYQEKCIYSCAYADRLTPS